MRFSISSFAEIDFSQIDPNEDEFFFDNELFRFSAHVCHVCWNGGTVLESENNFFCLHCQNYLQFREVSVQFENEEDAQSESFLLPTEWTEKEIMDWKKKFIEKRNIELKFRERMLNEQEGGDIL